MTSERLTSVLTGISIGSIFGFALEKSKVYLPSVIREQMKLQNFLMIKVFLAATAVGSIGIAVLDELNIRKRKPKAPLALGFGMLHGYGGNIVGGALLGVGITLSGGCPGTLVVQLGAGLKSAYYSYLGGLVGATVFAYLENVFRGRLKNFGSKKEPITLDMLLGREVLSTSVVFGSLLFGALYLIHLFEPNILLPQAILDSSWNPIYSGVIIGLLQIPSLLLIGTHLGTSSSYCTIAGSIVGCVDTKIEKNAPYFSRFFSKEDFWQVGIVIGMTVSAYISSPKNVVEEISPTAAFLGSALMLFGARLSGGCTSGHGISGMAGLSLASFVSVIFMFAGGIAAAQFV